MSGTPRSGRSRRRELRATGDGWSLVLRWSDRGVSTGDATSSIRVEAAGQIELQLPGGERIAERGLIERDVEPLLREPMGLQIVLERDGSGDAPLRVEHPDPAVRRAISDPTNRGRTCAGRLDLDGRVGFLDLVFLHGGARLVALRLEIFPAKLDYRRDFELMLSELGERHAERVISLLQSTYLMRDLDRRPRRSLKERYQIFDGLFPSLDKALKLIARQPNAGLTDGVRLRPAARVRRPDGRTRKAIRRAGGRLAGADVRLPARLPDAHRVPTLDTPANRFVRRVLESLVRMLDRAAERGQARRPGPWGDEVLRGQIRTRRRALRRWLGEDFLREASPRAAPPSLVVQRSPGYRDVLRIYRRMLLAFSLIAGELRMSLADLEDLYELWCAVRVESELEQILGRPERTETSAGRWEPLVDREVRYPGGTVLRTQRRFYEPDREGWHAPDLVIELTRPPPRSDPRPARFQFVLDAKYRLAWSDAGEPRPPRAAINAIHRYRDAALETSEVDGELKRVIYGGAILFPHPDETAFQASSIWSRMRQTGIGAIPLVPSQGRLLRSWLRELVYASPVRLARTGPRYPLLPPPKRTGTVLIAQTRYGRAQVEQTLRDGWYHLPDRFDLPGRRPSHLALYEAARGSVPGQIRHLLPILRWQLVSGERIRQLSLFGGGGADRYWLLRLDTSETALSTPIVARGWGPRHPSFVPLEVFDLADSAFMLRGSAAHVPLLRLLHHLRSQAFAGLPDGWQVREPILLGGRWCGELAADADGVRWEVGERRGECEIDALRGPIVRELFEPIRDALRVA